MRRCAFRRIPQAAFGCQITPSISEEGFPLIEGRLQRRMSIFIKEGTQTNGAQKEEGDSKAILRREIIIAMPKETLG